MTKELLTQIVSVMFSDPTPNILDWQWIPGQPVIFKYECMDDGMVEIHTINTSFLGYAKTTKDNDFSVVE